LTVLIPERPSASAQDFLRLKIELERDGFAAGRMIAMDKRLRKIAFVIENRTADAHKTGLRLSLPAGATYELDQNGRLVSLVATGDWDYPWRAELDLAGPSAKVELVRKGTR
jgi:hypothetical protein